MHAQCPLVEHVQWDYYVVSVTVMEVVDVNEIEKIIDQNRGIRLTQEEIAERIKESIPFRCVVALQGVHTIGSDTKVEV